MLRPEDQVNTAELVATGSCGQPLSHNDAGHGLSRKEVRLSSAKFFEPVDFVKLDTGQRRLNLEPAGTMSTSVIFRVPQEQGADPPPSRSASASSAICTQRRESSARRSSRTIDRA